MGRDGSRSKQRMSLVLELLEPRVLLNGTAASMSGVDLLWGLGLDGGGIEIAQWDGGAVWADHVDLDEDPPGTPHVRFVEPGAFLHSEHATHVAGTMIGQGESPAVDDPPGPPVETPAGYSRGMARGAKVATWDYANSVAELNAVAGGYLLSNHSYGDLTGWRYRPSSSPHWEWNGDVSVSATEDYHFGWYGPDARALDQIIYDHPNHTAVFSAGNDRNDTGPTTAPYEHWVRNVFAPGSPWVRSTTRRDPDGPYDSLNPPKSAKNILVVGAAKDVPPPADPHAPRVLPSQVETTDFSNWGPTDDGRIKPDLIANGDDQLSAQKVVTAGGGSTSYWDWGSGTSYAAPVVTGGIALLQQYHFSRFNTYMDAATVRALLCHTALDDDRPGPNYDIGWGLFDAKAAYDFIQQAADDPAGPHMIHHAVFLGDPIRVPLYYPGGGQPVKVTIAWTDPPGPAQGDVLDDATPRLVNDLNLRVLGGYLDEYSTDVHLPWVLDPANPSANATHGDNSVDNIEQVFIPASDLTPGWYTLEVTQRAGQTLTNGHQVFAAIVEGLEPRPDLYASLLKISEPYINNGHIDNAAGSQQGWIYSTFDIYNAGELDSGPFDVNFYLSPDMDIDPAVDQPVDVVDLDGSPLTVSDSIHFGNLEGRNLVSKTIAVSPPDFDPFMGGGAYYLGLVIDGQNVVEEVDESNNSNQGLNVDVFPVRYWSDPAGTVDIEPNDLTATTSRYAIHIEFIPPAADTMKVDVRVSDGTDDYSLFGQSVWEGARADWPGYLDLTFDDLGVPAQYWDPFKTTMNYTLFVRGSYKLATATGDVEWTQDVAGTDRVHWSPDVWSTWTSQPLPDLPHHDLSDVAGGETRFEGGVKEGRSFVPAGTPIHVNFFLSDEQEGDGFIGPAQGWPDHWLGEVTNTAGLSADDPPWTYQTTLTNIPTTDPFGTSGWSYNPSTGQYELMPYWITIDIDPIELPALGVSEYFRGNNVRGVPVYYYPDLHGVFFQADYQPASRPGEPDHVAVIFGVESRFGVAQPDWDIEFYLSDDATIDINDTLLGQYHVYDAIGPDGVMPGFVMLDLPAGSLLPGSTYTVGMILNYKSQHPYPEHDDDDTIPRQNNSNQGVGLDMAQIHRLPDLGWTQFALSNPGPLNWGGVVPFDFEVDNKGGWDAPASTVTAMLWTDADSPVDIGSMAIQPLPANTATGPLHWDIPLPAFPPPQIDSSQDPWLYLVVDNGNLVEEENEGDNSSWSVLVDPAVISVASASGAEIHGVKWNDVNNNGVQDTGEPGLGGWTIFLDDNQNGLLDAGETSTLTAADGSYSFTGLAPGSYTVAEELQPGWAQTHPSSPGNYVLSLAAGDVATDIDFGNRLAAEISGMKWNDVNGNGVRDAGEAGLSGWTIFLDDNQNGQLDTGERSTVTASDGTYAFTGLTSGTYTVAEVLQTGWAQTFPSYPGDHVIILAAGQAATNVDFGNRNVADIFGKKWNDINNNGVQDTGEPGLGGWTIFLDDNQNGLLDAGEISTATAADGTYSFRGLTPGTYLVAEERRPGWIQTFPASPGNHVVMLAAGDVATDVDFGNLPAAEIHGMKWNDLNGNGVRDAGEPGLGGWTIFLDDNQNGYLDAGEISTVTAADGTYSFTDLAPGSYTVAELLQTGWAQTFPASPGRHVLTLAAGVVATDIDFGNEYVFRPYISIDDVYVQEGDAGVTYAVFHVTLSGASALPITVDYAAVDRTATARRPFAGRLLFNPGETSKPIEVPVYGDTRVELDESFLMMLSNPVNALIADGEGECVILNDDGDTVVLDAANPQWGYTDVDGDWVVFTLWGPGQATITLDHATGVPAVAFAGTDPLASAFFGYVEDLGTVPNDGTDVTSLTGDPVRWINMPRVNVTGNTIQLAGPVQWIVARDFADGSDIILGGAADDELFIQAETVGDVDLAFPGVLRWAGVKSWADGVIDVGAVGAVFASQGSFGADILAERFVQIVYVQHGDCRGDITVTNPAASTAEILNQVTVVGGDILGSVRVNNGGGAGRIETFSSGGVGGSIGSDGGGQEIVVGGRLGQLSAQGEVGHRVAVHANVTADQIGGMYAVEGDVKGDVRVRNTAGVPWDALGELMAVGGSILGDVKVENGGDAGWIQASAVNRSGVVYGGQIGAAGKVVEIAGHLGGLLAIGDAAARGGDIVSKVTVGRVDAIQTQYGDVKGDVTVKNDNLPAAQRAAGYALGQLQALGGSIEGNVTVQNAGNAGLIYAQSIGGQGGKIGDDAADQINIAGRADQIAAQGEAGNRSAINASVTADQIGGMYAVEGDVKGDVTVLNAGGAAGYALGELEAVGGNIEGNVRVQNGGNAGLIRASAVKRSGAAVGGRIGAAGKVVEIAGHLDALIAVGDAAARGGDIVADVRVGRADVIQSQYGDILGDVTVRNDNLPAAQRTVGEAVGVLRAVGGNIAGRVEVQNGGNAGLIQATEEGGAGGRITSAEVHVTGDAQWIWADAIAAPVRVDGQATVRTTDRVTNNAATAQGSIQVGTGGYVWSPTGGWRRLNPGEIVYTEP